MRERMPVVTSTPPPPREGHWLDALDRALLHRLIGRRSLDVALASRLRYVRPPARSEGDGGPVYAVLGEDAGDDSAAVGPSAFRVEIEVVDGDTTLSAECSRCASTFGPCAHAAVLALDLASSRELREALLTGASTVDAVEHAPEIRAAVEAELRFEGALSTWLAPTAEGARVEISASPFVEMDPYVGRAYGDRLDPSSTRILAVVVRRAGERKLLASSEIAPQSRQRITLSARDRGVLAYTRDRVSGKKAVYALGVEASLTIEAMRVHRGVFADGYKGLLDFRSATVRPAVALRPAGTPGAKHRLDTLAAQWVIEGGGGSIAFTESAFFPGPFPFVWTKSGAIYRVARDVDLDLAAELERAAVLPVPPGKLRDAGARLLRGARGRGVALPGHETFGLPAMETPRIVLRLAGEPIDLTGELVAVYPTREVASRSSRTTASAPRTDATSRPRRGPGITSRLPGSSSGATATPTASPTTRGSRRPTKRRSRSGKEGCWACARRPLLRSTSSSPSAWRRCESGAPLVGRVHVVLEEELAPCEPGVHHEGAPRRARRDPTRALAKEALGHAE